MRRAIYLHSAAPIFLTESVAQVTRSREINVIVILLLILLLLLNDTMPKLDTLGGLFVRPDSLSRYLVNKKNCIV